MSHFYHESFSKTRKYLLARLYQHHISCTIITRNLQQTEQCTQKFVWQKSPIVKWEPTSPQINCQTIGKMLSSQESRERVAHLTGVRSSTCICYSQCKDSVMFLAMTCLSMKSIYQNKKWREERPEELMWHHVNESECGYVYRCLSPYPCSHSWPMITP